MSRQWPPKPPAIADPCADATLVSLLRRPADGIRSPPAAERQSAGRAREAAASRCRCQRPVNRLVHAAELIVSRRLRRLSGLRAVDADAIGIHTREQRRRRQQQAQTLPVGRPGEQQSLG